MPNRGEQGTGKHPHKSTAQPFPHTKESSGRSDTSDRSASGSRGEQENLKSREYRDEKGQVHHHTKSYMEQHRGSKSEERKH